MNKIKFVILFTGIIFSGKVFSQKPIFADSKLKEATVYFNSAEMKHKSTFSLPKGTSEIVIKNISNNVDQNTIQVLTPKGVTVLSTQFTTNYVSEYSIDETNPEIKKVRDSIQILNTEILKLNNDRTTAKNMLGILEKNQQVAGENNGLNILELSKLLDFYKTKSTELNNGIIAIDQKLVKYRTRLDILNSKLKTNEDKEEKLSNGKIVLRLLADLAINSEIELSYLTSSASWYPSYELKVDDINQPLSLVYKGNVVQQTGLDWKQVSLTLSSGNPNQSNEIPYLSSWFLRYGYPITYKSNNQMMNTAVMSKAKAEAFSEDASGRSITRSDIASLPVRSSSIGDYVQTEEGALNLSYNISVLYDIYSNGKEHMITLKEEKVPVTYSYYAVPKLNKDVFLLAEIANYSKYDLLPGNANIVFEGLYVGTTYIDASNTKDTLSIAMGRDKNIVVKKEKITDKSGTKVLSSQKESTFTYDITVRNNKKTNVKLVLKDQYPLSTDKDIVVELLNSDKAIINAEVGTMTWDIELKPNESKKVRFSYKVKYPKDREIGNL